MLTILVAISFVVAVNSIPLSPVPQTVPQNVGSNSGSTPVPIVSQTDVDNGNGNFTFGFEAGNGIIVQESGYVKQGPQISAKSAGDQPEDTSVQVIAGSFSYPAPDGTNISLTYVADENGFQPQGAHLPTPPPLPESVQRLLSALGNAPASDNSLALQASPSANYENIAQAPSAARSGKSIQDSGAVAKTATAAVASPAAQPAAASPAALPSAAPAPASTSAAAPSSSAAPAS